MFTDKTHCKWIEPFFNVHIRCTVARASVVLESVVPQKILSLRKYGFLRVVLSKDYIKILDSVDFAVQAALHS